MKTILLLIAAFCFGMFVYRRFIRKPNYRIQNQPTVETVEPTQVKEKDINSQN